MRRFVIAAAAASLLLVPAASAAAASPHGSGKPVSDGPYQASICGLEGVTLTTTSGTIGMERGSGIATPGTGTEVFTTASGSVTIRNANLTIMSESQDGPLVTQHYSTKGLLSLVRTSDGGAHPELTAAGRSEQTVVFNTETETIVSLEVTQLSGKAGSAGEEPFCAAVVAALT